MKRLCSRFWSLARSTPSTIGSASIRLSSFGRSAGPKIAVALALAALLPIWTWAQTVQRVNQPWRMTSQATLVITTPSQTFLMPSIGQVVWIQNIGTQDIYIAFGTTSPATATLTSDYLRAGGCGVYDLNPIGQVGQTAFIAGITTQSATLSIESGNGQPPCGYAQNQSPSLWTPVGNGYQRLAGPWVSTPATLTTGTTLTVPPGSRWAMICAENVGVRWRDDGKTPTFALGMPLVPVTSGSTASQANTFQNCMNYAGNLTTQSVLGATTGAAIQFTPIASGGVLDVIYYQ